MEEPAKCSERAPRRHEVTFGGVAQLGEHLPCKQGVRGSNPLTSTKEPIRDIGP